MRYLKPVLQILFICALSLIGQSLSTHFSLPLPGNLIGMFLLFLLLATGLVKEQQIAEGADLLLRYMALFFVPAGVGILAHFDLIQAQWLPWLSITLTSTVLVLVATAKAVEWFIRRGGAS